MEQKELTCIGCPMGCTVTVLVENGRVDNISGNHCKIGEEYARSEVTNPVRTLTSTIAVVPAPSGARDPQKFDRQCDAGDQSNVRKSADSPR